MNGAKFCFRPHPHHRLRLPADVARHDRMVSLVERMWDMDDKERQRYERK